MAIVSARGAKGASAILAIPSTVQHDHITPCYKDEVAFLAEAAEIAAVIADVKGPWADRVGALRRVQGMMLGGASFLPGFRDVVHEKLRPGLVVQVCDLRSQVVKEACNAVMVMCKYTSPALWEEMSAWFIPAMQKQLPVTVQAISVACNNAVRFLLENNRISNASLRAILECARHKNARSRSRSFEHLFVALRQMPFSFINPTEQDLLASTIVTGLGDADPTARQFARLSYWCVDAASPSVAGQMWANCTESQRKQVTDERSTYASIDAEIASLWSPRAYDPEHVEDLVFPLPERPVESEEDGISTVPQTLEGSTKSDPTSRTMSHPSTPDLEPLPDPKPAAEAPPAAQGPAGTPSGTHRAPKASPRNKGAPQGRYTPKGARSLTNPPRSATPVFTGARSNTPGGEKFRATPGQTNKLKTPPAASSAPVTVGLSCTPQRKLLGEYEKTPGKATAGTPTRALAEKTANTLHTHQKKKEEKPVGKAGIETALHDAARHQDWEVRATCFARLGGAAATPDFHPFATKVVELCLSKLTDPHFKVVAEVLDCLRETLRAHPQDAAPYLERILGGVFACMTEKKAGIKEKARSVADTVMGANTVATMFQSLMKVLDSSNPKVKVSTLECLLYTLQYCSNYLATPKTLRQALLKLLKVVASPVGEAADNKDVEKAAVACLQAMHNLHPNIFIEEAAALPPGQKQELVTHVQKAIPGFPQLLQAHKKVVRHADPSPVAKQPLPSPTAKATFHSTPTASTPRAKSPKAATPAPPPPPPPLASPAPPTPPPAIHENEAVKLLSSFDTSERRQRALRQLLQFSARQAQWEANFESFFTPVLRCLEDPEYTTRSLAGKVVQGILEHLPHHCPAVAEPLVASLLDRVDDPQSDVAARARETILRCSAVLPAAVLFPLIIKACNSPNEAHIQMAIASLMAPALARLPAEDFNGAFDTVRGLIYKAISHDSTDLRKAATWCLVDLYERDCDRALPLCRGLPPAKLRLLSFYLGKKGIDVDLNALAA